jgi:HK97 family phage portal protein
MQAEFAGLQSILANQQALLNVQFRQAGGFSKFDYQQVGAIRDGYNVSSAVYSIVSSIAGAASYIPLRAYIIKDEKAMRKLRAMGGPDFRKDDGAFRWARLKEMALEEVPDDDSLQMLLDHPNNILDRSTFYETAVGFKLLTGNSYIYTPVLEYGADKGKVSEMHIMPSPYTGLIITQTWPKQVLGYELILNGVQLLRTEDAIHIRTANYEYSIDGQELYGLSPLRAALRTLKRSNSAETSSTFQFENGGPAGVVYNKAIQPNALGRETMSRQKQANQDEYAGNENRGKVRYMAGDMGYLSLGLSPVDLDILESEKFTFDMLCNVWHVSSVMFNNKAASTESNVKEMRKDFYTRAVLPEIYSIRDAFNNRLVPKFSKAGKYYIDADISGIPELQPDMVQQAQWLNSSWDMTPNERREFKNLAPSPDPNMDKIFVPTSAGMPMDDVLLTDPNEDLAQQDELDQ